MNHKRIWLLCVVALLIAMVIMPARAQFNLELMGRDPFGNARQVYVDNSYAYVCIESTLLILNMANPTSPTKVGAIEIPDTANGVFVLGSYAYVTYGDPATLRDKNGLFIVNVFNPSAPGKVGDFSMNVRANGVFVVGSVAYVTADNYLYAVNIANRANPTILWQSPDLGGTARGVFVYEGFAYVGADSDLKKVNLTTHAVDGTYNAPNDILGVFVYRRPTDSLKVAYIALGGSGVEIIDISTMAYVSEYNPGLEARGVHGVGNYVCMAFGADGLAIGNPNLTTITNIDTFGFANSVFAVGNYAYVADGIRGTCAIGPLGATAEIKGYYVPFIDEDGDKRWDWIPAQERIFTNANSVATYGNYAYVGATGTSLRILNIANFSSPSAISAIHTPGSSFDISVNRNPVNFKTYAYVADGAGGLRIINVTNPAAPVEDGSYTNCSKAVRVFILERTSGVTKKVFAFVASQDEGLFMLDVTNPSAITEVVTNWFPSGLGDILGVFVVGNYVYMIGSNRLSIAEIVDQPALGLKYDETGGKKPFSDIPNTPKDVYVSGNYAYIAVEGWNSFGGDGGLWCIDVNNPYNLSSFGNWNTNFADTNSPATGVHVSGSFAYVTSWGSSFHVFNVSNPAAPSRIKLDQSPDRATAVFVSGNYAYITDLIKGLYIYAANTHAITATASSGGRITPSGVIQVANGGSQRFTIRAERDQSIRDVRVNGRSMGKIEEYTFTNVITGHTIYAIFEESRYTITATAGANGTIIPSTVNNVRPGDDVKFKVTPNTGYSIGAVKADGVGVLLDDKNEYTFYNVRSNHTIDATFVPKQYTITASAGQNGSISPSGQVKVEYGKSQVFSIVPNTGYAVKDVLVDGASVGAVTSYTFTGVGADHTILAEFAPIHYITASAGPNGIIIPSGIVQVADGGSQKFTFTPVTGYMVADVKINGISTGAPSLGNEFTFTNVKTAQRIEVTFVIQSYVIEATSNTGGVIAPSGNVSVEHGGSKAFTISPSVGYYIKDVLVDGASVGAVGGYTFANVTGPRKIAANFDVNTYDVIATAGENGRISPSGTTKASHGSSKTFSIIPNEGYHVADVKVDGVSVGALDTHTINNIVSPRTISATFAVNTYKINVIVEGEGSVTPSGEVTVNYNGNQTFTMTPKKGHHVGEVLVDGFSAGPLLSYTFVGVKSNRTLKVIFALDVYILRSSSSGRGTISPIGETRVKYGDSATFKIIPETGYQIDYIRIDGELIVGTSNIYTFTNVDKNHAIFVAFKRSIYEIEAKAGDNGSISPAGIVNLIYGANQAFNMTPNTGYVVSDVLVDGKSVGAVPSYTFNNVDANHKIEAQFALKTYTITATAGANGSITPSGELTGKHGSSIKFTIKPDANYHIDKLMIDGISFNPTLEYTFDNLSANHTISVTFAIDTLTITSSAGLNGTISPAGATKVNYGADQVFVMTPIIGYAVSDILVDGKSVGASDTYKFTAVKENHTISVSFAEKTYVITATAEGPGTITPSGDVLVKHSGMKIFNMKANAGARLVDVLVNGKSMGPLLTYQFTNVITKHTIIAKFEQKENLLLQNFPNPLNPETWIPFELRENSEVKIRIYNSTGRMVRELNLGTRNAGIYATPDKAAYWDGKDESGVPVASGIYFYSIQAGKFTAVKKMIVSK